ncbi:Rho GTPase activating protein, putative [Entamoeba histolytica HM-1:IMSS-B]|uniref:Rho GTPase activating protein, putative n=6 Tax=Entamoeba histolytica TaxID=5759 RepID=C4LV25_ENTH1|nr:Rho GTPase activating protein, putative [Entamoeba histolytica HM-1:IMSS]EMD47911.1 Rho GTPase activating protein, putative [Entamoeba histolytica KU27]EMH74398.1 Rho GTPase activating protein, putative [Entamoeba histolytica HM-1:IMSS-B]EMS17202.1 Rho GTPase activating protein [Entamoeba histolytica HM-3:IMSS]ENY64168.1 Rho GTPase activating protein, putative [Entamoeba histolytica HM-1:IMSS-A]GAT92499.1 Rho GTPase activating protein putative [Entamoeba histolytica]|eukprot:XP_650678.1 Rho GTPase activating protein, putative [Entamoeba histolytica HM-1:IMSS]
MEKVEEGYHTIHLWKGKVIEEKEVTYYIYNDMEILQIGRQVPIILRKAYLKLHPEVKGMKEEEIKLSFEIVFDKEYYFICKDKCEYWYWINKLSYFTHNIGVLGFPLLVAIRKSGWRVPNPIYRCIEYLEQNNGINVEGIFRMNGNAKDIDRIKDLVEHDQDIQFTQEDDCFIAASFLKLYLREMLEPLIPFNLYEQFIQLPKGGSNIKQFICQLPEANQDTLWFILHFLKKVVHNSEKNKMNAYNLSTCIALTVCSPQLTKSTDQMEYTLGAVESFSFLLTHFDEMFCEIEKRNMNKGMTLPTFPAFSPSCVDLSSIAQIIRNDIKKGFRSSYKKPSSGFSSPITSSPRGEDIQGEYQFNFNRGNSPSLSPPLKDDLKMSKTSFLHYSNRSRASCGDILEILSQENNTKKKTDSTTITSSQKQIETTIPGKICRSGPFFMNPDVRQKVIGPIKSPFDKCNGDVISKQSSM